MAVSTDRHDAPGSLARRDLFEIHELRGNQLISGLARNILDPDACCRSTIVCET
jgi:hypothetical protein